MIVCGTDFSNAAEPAVKAASAVAQRRGLELLLVHVLERDERGARVSSEIELEREAAELRREFSISVETRVMSGAPELALLAVSRERKAKLVVVGAEGSSKRRRRLGSVPEYLCQVAPVPILVVRRAEGFLAWGRNARPLEVLVGSGLGDASTSALAGIATWPDLGLTLVHVAWPYGEHYRLGVSGPMPLDHLRPEVHHQLIADLARWASALPCSTSPKLKVIPGWGRIDSHLAQVASEKDADLLVIGSHQRNAAARIWHGSVSRHIIHEASCNVLCVPQAFAKPHIGRAPRVVVVPTDLSPLADRAIVAAYALLPEGGSVHVVHCGNHLTPAEEQRLLAELGTRVPAGAQDLGVQTELKLLDGETPWLAIWQYANRITADLICMATHSRDVGSNLLLGSQAQALLQHSRIPVLMVPPDRES